MSIQEFAISAEWGQPSHSLPSIIYNVYHLEPGENPLDINEKREQQ